MAEQLRREVPPAPIKAVVQTVQPIPVLAIPVMVIIRITQMEIIIHLSILAVY